MSHEPIPPKVTSPAMPAPDDVTRLPLERLTDIIRARQLGSKLAESLGFGARERTHIATAISQVTRSLLQHTGATGRCERTSSNRTLGAGLSSK